MLFQNFSNVLTDHALNLGNKTAIIFQSDTGQREKKSYVDLYTESQVLAAKLKGIIKPGERVLLLYPPGIDFVVSFFACLYADLIPVPSQLTRKKNINKIKSIIDNASIEFGLCNEYSLNYLNKDDLKIELINTESFDIEKVAVTVAKNKQNDIAFLQYTSGSTADPKGVMVTHANLLNNCSILNNQVLQVTQDKLVVSWLPPFHDMGLIGCILQSIHVGATCFQFTPTSFVKKPINWLLAISEFGKEKKIVSGAPDFAYDLTVKKVNEADLPADFDLSNWELAFSGAEPVRERTLIAFYNKFKKYGFKYKTFLPVYGLAESTLVSTFSTINAEPKALVCNAASIQEGNKIELVKENLKNTDGTINYVSCGVAVDQHTMKIVDALTLENLGENRIGEIWLKGPSMAVGYWNNQSASEEIFNAYIDNEDGPYMRTGDLGFIRYGELYIVGRLKNMMIVHGKNHYPEDIEDSINNAHEALSNRGTVFSFDQNQEEVVAVVYELERAAIDMPNKEEIIQAIKRVVSSRHGLRVQVVSLVKPFSVPMTSSGKLQRQKIKQQFLNRELELIYESGQNGSVYIKEEEKAIEESH